jgi:2'-5' RNA ligase
MDKNVEYVINYLDDRIVFNQSVELPTEYALVIRPDEVVSESIETFIWEASKQDKGHRYYDRANLHATIYAPIDTETQVDKLFGFLSKELGGKELEFDVEGVASSVIVVRPVNFSLLDLRRKLAGFLNDSKRLDRDPIMESMTWMTFLRFKDKPNESYYDFIQENRTRSFGCFKPRCVELYKTHQRILDESVEKIFSIKLKG